MAARTAFFTVAMAACVACKVQDVAPIEPPTKPDTVERDPADNVLPGPGFVLYANNLTIVIADDGTVTSAAGLWILDESIDPPAVTRPTWEPPSLVVELPVPPPEEVGGEVFEPCSTDGQLELASLVGGRLYALGWTWNGACYMSQSVYDSLAISLPVVATPGEIDPNAFDLWGCDDTLSPAQLVPAWPPLEPYECTTDADPEAEVPLLRRGWLWLIEDAIFHAGGNRWMSRTDARPESCPSANDPCGDPSIYPGIDEYDEFWIRTDGSLALAAVGNSYTLVRRNGSTTRPAQLEADARNDVIGVRVHDDVAPLRRAIIQARKE